MNGKQLSILYWDIINIWSCLSGLPTLQPINDVLRDMLNNTVFVYQDDILIFWLSSHVLAVQKVLDRLLKHQLFVKAVKCELIVEVDAFNMGVRAILSQCAGKIHPCAFLSKLLPAERNYDVGDRELLVVKTVLEDWRHWLEGAEQPFVVWTDHKNFNNSI